MSGITQMMGHDAVEWGRELTASELEVKTVTILSRDGRRGVTAWVVALDLDFAVFGMGVIKTTLILRILPDGTLVDDTAQVRVFEYRGDY